MLDIFDTGLGHHAVSDVGHPVARNPRLAVQIDLARVLDEGQRIEALPREPLVLRVRRRRPEAGEVDTRVLRHSFPHPARAAGVRDRGDDFKKAFVEHHAAESRACRNQGAVRRVSGLHRGRRDAEAERLERASGLVHVLHVMRDVIEGQAPGRQLSAVRDRRAHGKGRSGLIELIRLPSFWLSPELACRSSFVGARYPDTIGRNSVTSAASADWRQIKKEQAWQANPGASSGAWMRWSMASSTVAGSSTNR
ncbi:MAG: hypothetical protein A3H35_12765 [Betaproteobacteria bacterium RIFCSPLOWO2_02_FULL_62_17]|nr:MAG: hypothetical protein A3H35_12765 [Betaproteobacteria bacterium RIFCSPLOWO2_02_FULL_62_17]